MSKSNFSILVHRMTKYLEWDQTLAQRVVRRAAPLDIKGDFTAEYHRLTDMYGVPRINISDSEGEELYKLTLDYMGKRNVQL